MCNAFKVPVPMELQNDFEDLCASLNGRSVEYLIVGGYALAFHGAPRFTGDIDIFVRPAPDNIDRLLTALGGFGRARFALRTCCARARFWNLAGRRYRSTSWLPSVGSPGKRHGNPVNPVRTARRLFTTLDGKPSLPTREQPGEQRTSRTSRHSANPATGTEPRCLPRPNRSLLP